MKFLQISGPMLRWICGPEKEKNKLVGARPKIYPGPVHSLYSPDLRWFQKSQPKNSRPNEFIEIFGIFKNSFKNLKNPEQFLQT
jgi:hypothetical protein